MEIPALILVFLSIVMTVMTFGRLLRTNSIRREPGGFHGSPNAFGKLTGPLANAIPISQAKREKLQKDLLRSGRHHSTALANYLAGRNVALMCVLFGLAAVLLAGMARGYESVVFVAAAVLIVFVFCLPRIVLSIQSERRAREIENGFPDFLDMMLVSVEGGLPVERSLARVSAELAESHPSLCRELQIVARQARTGSLDHALRDLGARIDVPEVVACAMTLRQGKRLGVKISEGLRDSADRMRDIRRQRAEQAGNLASLKLLLPVVLCLAPPVFILLIGPAVLDLREFINREKENVSAVVEQANLPEQANAVRN